MWRAIFPLSSTQLIYPKNSIEQVIVVVKVHEQSHFLMYFQHVYFADVCHVLCLPSLGHALSLPLQRKAGVDKGWGGRADAWAGHGKLQLQPKLWLPRSQFGVLALRPCCFSSGLIASFQCNSCAGGEQPISVSRCAEQCMLQFFCSTADPLKQSRCLLFTIDEKIGGDLLCPACCWRVRVPFWQMHFPTSS